MNTLGKNIGIARPRPNPPRPNKAKIINARYQYPNSIKNSYYNTLNFHLIALRMMLKKGLHHRATR